MQILKLFLVVSVLSLFSMGCGFLVTSFTKTAVIDEIMQNAANDNAEELQKRIDFPALRRNLKDHLKAQKNAIQKIGIGNLDGGTARSNIDGVVDYYVQPENIKVLLALKDRHFGNTNVNAFLYDTDWVSPFSPLTWQAVFGLPVASMGQSDDPRAALVNRARSSLQVKFVFKLDGLTWRVREMHVPLLLVPERPYNRPLTDIFRIDNDKENEK